MPEEEGKRGEGGTTVLVTACTIVLCVEYVCVPLPFKSQPLMIVQEGGLRIN